MNINRIVTASLLRAVVVVFLFAAAGFGQEPAPQAPAPQTPPPQSEPPAGTQQQTPGRQPNVGAPPSNDRTPQTPFDQPQQIFLSGSVRLADGSPPPTSVIIERVCGGVVRPEAYTDMKGHFSFILGGQNSIGIADASVSNDPISRSGSSRLSSFDLAGCELRANLPGYQSDSVLLAFRSPLDNPDVGIIHIRRLGNVEGFTYSITTALAPKDARKAYEKGLDVVKKQKWSEAEREFNKAVAAYPKYAVAWYELGRVYQQQKKFEDAARAYTESVKIDPKFVNPYAQLTVVSVLQQKWDDVAGYTLQILKLNPYAAPEIYFYSAVANFNLQNVDLAEEHAREAAKLDTQRKTPRINHLLGVILAEKGEFKDAAEQLRIYLKHSPNAPDAEKVKEQLAEMEKVSSR